MVGLLAGWLSMHNDPFSLRWSGTDLVRPVYRLPLLDQFVCWYRARSGDSDTILASLTTWHQVSDRVATRSPSFNSFE